MKKRGKDRLKYAACESTLFTAGAVPLPQWGRQRGGGFAAKRKPTPPRCARQPLPREGARVDTPPPPSFERRCPEGAEVGWGKRYEKERERSSQVRHLREHPIHRYAVPLPQWGRLRGGGFAAPKGSQPRLVALGSPFQGKGLAWTLPPSYGRRCPEGAEVGWGKRYEREWGYAFQAGD